MALAFARSARYVPGSNLERDAAAAAWRLLLPRLDLDSIVCLGTPPGDGLAALAGAARTATVVCPSERAAAQVNARAAAGGLEGLEAIALERLTRGAPADLVLVTTAAWLRRVADEPALRTIAGDARAVFVADVGRARAGRALQVLDGHRLLWLAPGRGDVHSAAALADQPTVSFLRDLGGPADTHGSLTLRGLARRARQRREGGERTGALLLRAEANAAQHLVPPAYVREIARHAGVELERCRAGLSAPSKYASRKAVLFVFSGDAQDPRLVVKLSRLPATNPRLENEWRALRALSEHGIGAAETVPQPAFMGHHAGLVVVGETAVQGSPFRSVTSARPDCALAGAAIEWLSALGAATAHTGDGGAADAADALRALLQRFAEIYRPAPATLAFLREQIDAIEAARGRLPLVFQHGDPGTWNLLVTDGGRPAFLDWEAFEPRGIPLWDLFYFVRSFAVLVARARGEHDALRGFAAMLLAGGPLHPLLRDSVGRHAAEVGLDPALAEPLFFTCWMHRALKEATRRRRGDLARAHYLQLLELCIARRAELALTPPGQVALARA